MTDASSQKVVFMGLGASGKTSIRSVIFEGKATEDVAEYSATINYTRSSKSLVGTVFQIFDCGGQESFISNFVGEQAEFIFSDVKILIWVVDVSDFTNVSPSKFYFDQAAHRLAEYSPGASIYCLFHKTDLLNPDMREALFENMKQYFIPPLSVEIQYRATSIFDLSIFQAFGEMMRLVISQSSKAHSLDVAVQNFVQENQEFSGITVYTDDDLPIIEAGVTNKNVPANLWMSNIKQFGVGSGTQKILRSTMETDKNVFVFQKISDKIFLAGVSEREVPLQFVIVKMDQLAEIVSELL